MRTHGSSHLVKISCIFAPKPCASAELQRVSSRLDNISIFRELSRLSAEYIPEMPVPTISTSNFLNTWLFAFSEDILYIRSETSRKQNKQLELQTLGIDLGWYPEGDPNGSFTLYASRLSRCLRFFQRRYPPAGRY